MSDSVPNYQSPGTDNIRANPTFRESPGPQSSPSGSGAAAGGVANTDAQEKTFHVEAQKTPSGGKGPGTPQSFTDDCV